MKVRIRKGTLTCWDPLLTWCLQTCPFCCVNPRAGLISGSSPAGCWGWSGAARELFMPGKCNLQPTLPWSGAAARVEVRGLKGTEGKENSPCSQSRFSTPCPRERNITWLLLTLIIVFCRCFFDSAAPGVMWLRETSQFYWSLPFSANSRAKIEAFNVQKHKRTK